MLPVIVVRSFLDGNLSNVDTWGTMSPLNDVATEASSEKLQINLIIKECLNNEPHRVDNSNNKSTQQQEKEPNNEQDDLTVDNVVRYLLPDSFDPSYQMFYHAFSRDIETRP